VNKAWKGRRYATKESKSYQKELWLLLPPKIDIPEGRLEITFEFGMSMILKKYTTKKPLSQIL
jgi:hypothetical protein